MALDPWGLLMLPYLSAHKSSTDAPARGSAHFGECFSWTS
jgi:hypothetical protein